MWVWPLRPREPPQSFMKRSTDGSAAAGEPGGTYPLRPPYERIGPWTVVRPVPDVGQRLSRRGSLARFELRHELAVGPSQPVLDADSRPPTERALGVGRIDAGA